ncbi:hypothetical protein ENU1_143260 [Entamoeba nuttalli P19]|uniref:Uncharacterized protein n=2 Tax=Entamoeba nuttalli TaxID=412467 RepID=K2H915_ENTNP|nr:hypothetical protein ENU1_143260 [Entamoeba nuttalli P19]EKE39054.1 hypothetical protein ENU1_143260 [Entamoeba nuttalli P19]|eukprot:XP_008858612.1 hypothetical protein ENU1_143260 [Entamoeba nuttalli P19]
MEEKQIYFCVVCGCPLLFTGHLFDPPEDSFLSPSPQTDGLSNISKTKPKNNLFNDDSSEESNSSFTSPIRTQPRSFTEEDTFHPNEIKERSQSSIPKNAVVLKPKVKTGVLPPKRKGGLKTLFSFSQSAQPIFSEIEEPLFHFNLSYSSVTEETTKELQQIEEKKINKQVNLPKYPVSVVEPTIALCKIWEIEFPICSKCYQVISSALEETLAMLSSEFRKQRIKYQELIEYSITETLDEDIKKELEEIEKLTDEVTSLQIQNVRLHHQKIIVNQLRYIETMIHQSHCQQLNVLVYYSSYSVIAFHIPQNSRVKRLEKFLSSTTTFDHLFHINWINNNDISINGTAVVTTLLFRNKKKYALIVDTILRMIRVLERQFSLNPLQLPNIHVKKPDDFFMYCLVSLHRFIIYTNTINAGLIIPYYTNLETKKIGRAQFIPVCLNNSYEMFEIGLRFFFTDVKILIDYATKLVQNE